MFWIINLDVNLLNKKLNHKIPVLFLIFFVVISFSTISVLGDLQYKLKISDAGYGDFDSYGSMNDVFINFDINISLISNTANFKLDNSYKLDYTLKLPSGLILENVFLIKFIKPVSDYSYQIIHYNVINETGMYKANLELFDSNNISLCKGNIVFDPPTAGSGGPVDAIL